MGIDVLIAVVCYNSCFQNMWALVGRTIYLVNVHSDLTKTTSFLTSINCYTARRPQILNLLTHLVASASKCNK